MKESGGYYLWRIGRGVCAVQDGEAVLTGGWMHCPGVKMSCEMSCVPTLPLSGLRACVLVLLGLCMRLSRGEGICLVVIVTSNSFDIRISNHYFRFRGVVTCK